MTHTKTLAIVGLVAILGATVAASSNVNAKAVASVGEDSLSRVAKRLQKRIEIRFNQSPALSTLRSALAYRRATFTRTVTVALQDNVSGQEISSWSVSLGKYPDWMTLNLQGGAHFELDERVIETALTDTPPDGLIAPSFASVTETHEDGNIVRATIDGEVQNGHLYNATVLTETIIHALENGQEVAVVPVQSVQGAVLYDDGSRTFVLHELGVGRSEFRTSPWGRKQNVRKAMNEKANGVIIPHGTTFSFNSTLGGKITYANGWYESLIIVNGKDLEPAPGGGICQAATTVFRAAVAAGLPIKVRKSHSLYVTYYKQYGMGLDATVFPGKQDMQFENDTPGPIILVGKTDSEDNAYSTIYGLDDDRDVQLAGPYFGYTHTDPVLGQKLRNNQVAWIQRVTAADGTTREDLLVAQYLQLPKSVALEFEPVMHGAGDLVADAR